MLQYDGVPTRESVLEFEPERLHMVGPVKAMVELRPKQFYVSEG